MTNENALLAEIAKEISDEPESVQEITEQETEEVAEFVPEETQEQEVKPDENVEITDLKGLVEAIDVDPEFLYGLDVPMGDNEEPVKLGSLKDAFMDAKRESRGLQDQITQYKQQLEAVKAGSSSLGQWTNEMIQAQGQMAMLQQQFDNTDWTSDEVDKGELALYRQQLTDGYAKAQNQFTQAQEQQAQHAQQSIQLQQQAEREALLKAIPAWSDEAVSVKEKTDIVNTAKSYGFEENDIRGVMDHRVVLLLRDLAQLKANAAKAKESASKIRKAPKVLGTRQRQQSTDQSVNELIQQARQGGKNKSRNEVAAAKAILFGEKHGSKSVR